METVEGESGARAVRSRVVWPGGGKRAREAAGDEKEERNTDSERDVRRACGRAVSE